MDDIVITGNNLEEIIALKTFLDDKFKIKDWGELNYFLGMKIVKVLNGLVLTQRKFALDVLKEFQCDTFLLVVCPLGALSKAVYIEELLVDATSYRNW